jgi:glycosyltransferase involved in cell wall biosynthesis
VIPNSNSLLDQMFPKKSQLVVITHTYYPAIGGVETFIQHLLAKLGNAKYDITIFTSDKNFEAKADQYQHHGIDVHVIKSFSVAGIVFPVSVRGMTHLVKKLSKADFVHQHDIKFLSGFLSFLTFFFPYRLLLFSHGYMYHSNRFAFLKHLFMRYFSLLSTRYTRVVNISVPDFEIATKYRFRNSVLIKEAVDLSTFADNPKKQQDGNFLYFGRITKNKGLENLFRCLSTINEQLFRITIVGNGEEVYIKELRDHAQKLKIDKFLSWKHNLSNKQLLDEVAKAEVIFLPSIYEGFGISLLESIASRSRILAQSNDAYSAILNELDLSHCLFDFKKHDQFAGKLQKIRSMDTAVCETLSLYDHSHMTNLIEEAQFESITK